MPVAASESLIDDIQTIADNFDTLEEHGDEGDIEFLKKFLCDPRLHSLLEIQEELEDDPLDATGSNGERLVVEVIDAINNQPTDTDGADELGQILSNPHFKGMLQAHDDIALKHYGDDFEHLGPLDSPPPPVFEALPDNFRLVGIRKSKTEPLGVTVKLDDSNDLVIARILAGSLIDKQGLLHVGDIIREVNDIAVMAPEHLMDVIRSAEGSITFKIIPAFTEQHQIQQVFQKAHFNYDPMKDRLIPCKEAGLPFRDGDILQILNADDANWWQVVHSIEHISTTMKETTYSTSSTGIYQTLKHRFLLPVALSNRDQTSAKLMDDDECPTGIIPSQQLEEKRKAFVQPDYDYSKGSLLCGLKKKKKKKINYSTKNNKEFDKCDVVIYEEVAKMPPFERKTLIIVGAQGVGRRSLKERLLRDDRRRFGSVMPYTTRPPRDGEEDGRGYYFITREEFERDIKEDKFLEFGEFNGNYYGTKEESVFNVIRSGRMCVLDISPSALKALKDPSFMPFIVFLAAASVECQKAMFDDGRRVARQLRQRGDKRGPDPNKRRSEEEFIKTLKESSMIEQKFSNYFDMTIVNDNFEMTYKTLRKAIEGFSRESQWVPVNWVY